MTKITNEHKIKIEAYREANWGYGKIATHLGYSRSTIAKHCQKIVALKNLPPRLKLYKGKIQGRKRLEIKQFILYNPKATLEDIKVACDLDCCISTIWSYLQKYGMLLKKAKYKIIISNTNKELRVAFCRDMLSKSDDFLNSIMFSDETIVKSRKNGDVVVYRAPPGKEYFEPSNSSTSKSVMFWGLISKYHYGPLVQIIGKNTGSKYITTLTENLLPEIRDAEGPVVFQQDNATIHKTPAVISFFNENSIEYLKWPPQSPDLSPIENIWNVMKMKMKAQRPKPRTHAKMRDAMLEIWTDLVNNDNGIRLSLVSGFKDRLVTCLKNKGELVKI